MGTGMIEAELGPLNSSEEKDENEPKCEEFDDILELVGSQGRFQKIILYAIVCPIITLEPFFTLNTIFMLFIPDHWCSVPGRNMSTTLQEWKYSTIPLEIGPDGRERFSHCKMYDLDRNIVQCQNGWEYDTADFSLTLPSEFDWVCTRASYATDALTLYAIGNAVGTIVFGQLADKYGRKPIFFIALLINLVLRTVSLFVPQFIYVFLLLQFLIGTAFPVMFISPSMIVAESCDKAFRGFVYSITWAIWVGGMAFLPLLAWYCGTWFLIGMVTSLPGFFLFVYYFYLPESPRWLVSVGRIKEATTIVLKMAVQNGTSERVTQSQIESMLTRLVSIQTFQNESTKGRIGVWTLFTRPWLAKNTIMLTISWSMNVLVYYGITLNTANMAGSQFLNFFLLSVIELPSSWLGGYLVDKVGRRWTQVGFFFVSMTCCLTAAIGVVQPHLTLLVLISVFMAKFAITLTFLVVYLQGTEIFPTQLRSTGSGFSATISSTVGTTGPYIIYLGQFNPAAPYLVLGAMSLAGMLASSFLPETFKQALPETIEDANTFGKSNKFWSFLPEEVAAVNRISSNGSEAKMKVDA